MAIKTHQHKSFAELVAGDYVFLVDLTTGHTEKLIVKSNDEGIDNERVIFLSCKDKQEDFLNVNGTGYSYTTFNRKSRYFTDEILASKTARKYIAKHTMEIADKMKALADEYGESLQEFQGFTEILYNADVTPPYHAEMNGQAVDELKQYISDRLTL